LPLEFKNNEQDLKKSLENNIEVHYLFIEIKNSTTIHKQHLEIHSEFKP
jgi:hypothetical protein